MLVAQFVARFSLIILGSQYQSSVHNLAIGDRGPSPPPPLGINLADKSEIIRALNSSN